MSFHLRLALGMALAALAAPLSVASAQVDGEPCCSVVANASLRRLGRVVVAYPIAATGTRLDVFRAGQTQSIAGGYGNQALDLLPGTYDVEISGKRVAGVTVQSGQETQIKVGVLRVQAGGNTRVDVVELGGGKNLVGSYGDAVFGLPIGRFDVKISGQTETVTVAAGQTTEF